MSGNLDRTEQLHAAETKADKAREKQHQRMDAANAIGEDAKTPDSETHPPKDAEKPAVGKPDRAGEDDMEANE